MMGYLANPELGDDHVSEIEKKTSDAIDAEGWLHSEDKGCIDEHGFYRITGAFIYINEDSWLENEDSSLENEDSSIENEDSSIENEDSSLENEDSSLENEDSSIESTGL